MSWQASGYVKDLECCPDGAPLSRGQKFLALILADYHNTDRRAAWPSVPTLAREALTSHSQVKRDLNYLEEHLLIRKLRPQRVGRGWICGYQFLELDAKEDLKKLRNQEKKGVHSEPLFSAAKRSSEGVHIDDEKGSEGVQKGSTTSNAIRKNKELETNKQNEERDARPSLDQVIAYCRERNNNVNPARFFNYYSANGWKIGRNPIQDWKAAVMAWETNPYDRPNGSEHRCELHPGAGFTDWGECWGCYGKKYTSGCEPA